MNGVLHLFIGSNPFFFGYEREVFAVQLMQALQDKDKWEGQLSGERVAHRTQSGQFAAKTTIEVMVSRPIPASGQPEAGFYSASSPKGVIAVVLWQVSDR